MYSIKAVAQATGLTVETLRAWERRYGAIQPRRDSSGRRVYATSDVVRLRRLREATERGHPIGRVATLSDEQLSGLLAERPERQNRAASSAFVNRMLVAAESFRPAECEQALSLAISLLPPAQLIDDVLGPLLREVGQRWHTGDFSVAQERLVSACVRRQVALLLDSYGRMTSGPGMVFATLSGERHELGLLMAALVAASRGFRCHYLGPDLPADELAEYAGRVGANVVAISVVLGTNLSTLLSDLERLARRLSVDCGIWIGGSALEVVDPRALPGNCWIIRDQSEFHQRLNLLNTARH